MKMNVDPELASRRDLALIAENTFAVLSKAIGRSSDRVTAEWSLTKDSPNRPQLLLTLMDGDRKFAPVAFVPEDLQPPEKARRRFSRIWDSILEKKIDEGLRELKAMAASVDE